MPKLETLHFSVPQSLLFFQTFAPYMRYIPNWVLSLLPTMQQPEGTPQWPVQLTLPLTKQTTHSQPTNQVATSATSQGWQSASFKQNDLTAMNKILIDPKGNT